MLDNHDTMSVCVCICALRNLLEIIATILFIYRIYLNIIACQCDKERTREFDHLQISRFAELQNKS